MHERNDIGKKKEKKCTLNVHVEMILRFFSLGVFKDNFAMINRHNLETDMGLHSYTLKINQFGDMVY
jgi:hypothetical protein